MCNAHVLVNIKYYYILCSLLRFISSCVVFSSRSPMQANRVDVFFCIKLKGTFDPRQGLDIIHFIMKYFARLILHPLVRPFVLLFFGLTSTASLAMLFRVKIGLDQTLALPKVQYVQ